MEDFPATRTLQRALHLLVSDPLLRNLQVRSYEDFDATDEDFLFDTNDNDDDAPVFVRSYALGQLSRALERHGGINEINFHGCSFERRNEPALEELFGRVLPAHATLTRISFTDGQMDPHYVELLTGALTKAKPALATATATANVGARLPSPAEKRVSSISSLSFTMTPLCRVGVRAVARMVRSSAPALQRLTLSDCDLDSKDAKLICDGLSTNTALHSLDLEDANIVVHGDTLRHALTPASPLREISLDGVRWTLEGIFTFFTALRANRTLERVVISRPEMGREGAGEMPLWEHLFEQLLAHHNFTIRRIEPFASGPNRYMASLLQSNECVRVAHAHLDRAGYRVEARAAWPEALGRVSRKPSLVQAFLRRGNVAALAAHLQEVANLRRPRPPPSPVRR